MNYLRLPILAGAALAAVLGMGFGIGSSTIPAAAQYYPDQDDAIPPYTTWQPEWSQYRFDRRHVMVGVVVGFSPYRLTIQRRNGMQQTVDLRNGTIIYPTGATPQPGEMVSMVGRYSNGTFVVSRLILRT